MSGYTSMQYFQVRMNVNHCLFHFFIDLPVYHLQMMNSKIWSTKIICLLSVDDEKITISSGYLA